MVSICQQCIIKIRCFIGLTAVFVNYWCRTTGITSFKIFHDSYPKFKSKFGAISFQEYLSKGISYRILNRWSKAPKISISSSSHYRLRTLKGETSLVYELDIVDRWYYRWYFEVNVYYFSAWVIVGPSSIYVSLFTHFNVYPIIFMGFNRYNTI